MNKQNPAEVLAYNILTTFIKGTRSRSYTIKEWEFDIVTQCLSTLGIIKVNKKTKCKCGGYFAVDSKTCAAACLSCSQPYSSIFPLITTCPQCKQAATKIYWTQDEQERHSKYPPSVYECPHCRPRGDRRNWY